MKRSHVFLWAGGLAVAGMVMGLHAGADEAAKESAKEQPKEIEKMEKVVKTEEEWRKQLTPMQYKVTREAATERAFTGEYWNTKDKGEYKCVGCGAILFTSDTKFDSGCGWPSFFEPADNKMIGEKEDLKFGMRRVEVVCNRCNAHLGHVFTDGPKPTGLRYCINSASLKFDAKDKDKAEAQAGEKPKE